MIKKNPLPASDLLQAMFVYDAESGILTWRVSKGRAKAGDIAGKPNASGHLALHLNGKNYLAHRIIWKMVFGADPIDEIDHIDCDPANNRIGNLRECSRTQNMANARVPFTNTSGFKCVTFNRATGKWHAKIRAEGRENHIGYFETLADAASAVTAARAKLHGEFARAA